MGGTGKLSLQMFSDSVRVSPIIHSGLHRVFYPRSARVQYERVCRGSVRVLSGLVLRVPYGVSESSIKTVTIPEFQKMSDSNIDPHSRMSRPRTPFQKETSSERSETTEIPRMVSGDVSQARRLPGSRAERAF